MSKPLGVNVHMQVVRPTKTEDAVYDAVEAAVIEGVSIKQFVAIVWEAWEYEIGREQKGRMYELRAALKGRSQ